MAKEFYLKINIKDADQVTKAQTLIEKENYAFEDNKKIKDIKSYSGDKIYIIGHSTKKLTWESEKHGIPLSITEKYQKIELDS